MHNTIKNYVNAEKARREESGEGGFSLVELIIVVVILGILAAIAIPVFLGIQGQAAQSSLASVAANGASQVASAIAQDEPDATINDFSNLEQDGIGVDVAPVPTTEELSLDNFCVTATKTGLTAETSGPGCP